MHYAGQVEYDASAFISSNRDELNEELVTMMLTSNVPLFEDLLVPEPEPEPETNRPGSVRSRQVGQGFGGSKKRAPTMAQQFKKQVLHLMDTLNATEPHFIRCLKPNEEKKSNLWDEKRMHEQIVFNGIPENVRIAQAGFVWRLSWENFISRYKLLSPRTWPSVAEGCPLDRACEFICEDADLESFQYVVGHRSKVFIKEHSVVDALELKRTEALADIIIPIAKVGRGFSHRRAFLRLKRAALKAAAMWRCRVLRRRFLAMKRAAVIVQRYARGMVQRMRFKRLVAETRASRIILTFAKGWSVRHGFPPEWRQRIKAAGDAVRERKRKELKGAIYLQTLFRRYKWRKLFLKQQSSVIKIQYRGKKMMKLKRLKLRSAVLMQIAIRRFKARKAFMKQKDSAIKIQYRGRKMMKLKRLKFSGAMLLQKAIRRFKARRDFMKKKVSVVKIQAQARMRICRREWQVQRKAIFFIALRIRCKLAKMRMKMVKRANKLKFQLLMTEGTYIHRLLDSNERCEVKQKIWCDPEMTTLRISWLPPVKGKGNEHKGGKRIDEHPMRISEVSQVNVTKQGDEAILNVKNKDGRCWVLCFPDLPTCVIVSNGLTAISGI
jgi:myosin heavy subunit